MSGSSGVNPWRGGTEAKSSFECGWAGGTGGVLRGECEMRLVADDPNVRSGVRIMFALVVSVVNGEPALEESIANAMSGISKMLCCLNGLLWDMFAHYVLHYLMVIGALSFRMQLLDLSA